MLLNSDSENKIVELSLQQEINLLDPQWLQWQLLNWQQVYGRHDLPWQQPRSPYRVWVSEVMLQQTQVVTVIDYFNRFITEFETVSDLASAQLDQVLRLWTGLGYYARARHLHAAAQHVISKFHGVLPNDLATLMTLPGIGRSTAGAIMALGYGQRAAILDGNVRRILARLHVLQGNLTHSKLQKLLWKLAEEYTPQEKVMQYTQGIMDLGALICTPKQPKCEQCPLQMGCLAYQSNSQTQFPQRFKKAKKPERSCYQLVVCATQQQRVWLQQRPLKGIWAGLWSFPEFSQRQELLYECRLFQKDDALDFIELPKFKHTFTHFHLIIYPIVLLVSTMSDQLLKDVTDQSLPKEYKVQTPQALYRDAKSEASSLTKRLDGAWYAINESLPIGVCVPVKKILTSVKQLSLINSK